jgi:hypothetical protein
MKLLKHLTANDIKLTEFPFKMELSMEAYLIENSEVLLLDNDDYSEIDIIDTELAIKNGRGSKKTDGRIDILAVYNQRTIAIIELKLGQLNETHLQQLEDYLQTKDNLVSSKKDLLPEKNAKEEYDWIGILVGSSIDESLKNKILNGYKIGKKIPVAALTITRFRGVDNQINQIYVMTNTYFKEDTTRNSDKYKFNGSIYAKNRLVLAVVKKYVEDNPNATFSILKNKFPDKLQGSNWGVFTSLADAENVIKTTNYKRHFIRPEEIITLVDGSKIAVCTNWGSGKNGNIERFIMNARNLEYKIDIAQ